MTERLSTWRTRCAGDCEVGCATNGNGTTHVFDIRRDATRQLGFGHGAHARAGQGLARMETKAMLRALAQRVDRIELTSAPRWAVNNINRRHERLPLKLITA
jgi:cytochrome P450